MRPLMGSGSGEAEACPPRRSGAGCRALSDSGPIGCLIKLMIATGLQCKTVT